MTVTSREEHSQLPSPRHGKPLCEDWALTSALTGASRVLFSTVLFPTLPDTPCWCPVHSQDSEESCFDNVLKFPGNR